ncbi:MAG: efflux RND transporter periplasmic adaptor subunit [Myxococcota bacterium]
MTVRNSHRARSVGVCTLGAFVSIVGGAACRGDDATGRRSELVPVIVTQVETRTVPLTIRAIGTAEAHRSVAIKAQVGGTLTAVHFRDGDVVAPGALLFSIDARPFEVALHEAQARLARDEVLLRKADADVRRYADLAKNGYVPREQADQTTANAESLRATVQADRAAVESARLQLDYCAIRAPIGGRVGQALVDAGNVVRANDTQALVMLLATHPIDVRFSVPERMLGELRKGAEATPRVVTVTPPGYRGAPLIGKLVFVDNAVDRASGTLLLKAELDNTDDALWPGQFVDVVLTLREDADAIVVPNEVVQRGRDGTYVFVVKSDESVELRPVTVARDADGVSVIATGLVAGETVVRDGQLRLAPGTKVSRAQDLTQGATP